MKKSILLFLKIKIMKKLILLCTVLCAATFTSNAQFKVTSDNVLTFGEFGRYLTYTTT
jgi:hypothetical protein